MMTDPRFGQFSDPQFMRSTFGVLPTAGNPNGGVQSASSPWTNKTPPSNTGRQTQPGNPGGNQNAGWETSPLSGERYQLDTSKATMGEFGGGLGTRGNITALDTGHGILTDPTEINRYQRSTSMATGGVVPDGTEDDTPDDAMDVIGQVLAYGRKKNGMPEKLFSWVPARPAGPGGDKPDDNPFPTKDGGFGKRVGMNDTEEPDTQTFMHGGDVLDPTINQADEENAGSFAEGGVIPDSPDAGDEGDQPQSQQMNPQMAMRYLSGADAMPPEMAMALEAQVDPQGQMDPAVRKLQAIAKAGDPDKAWGLMQHYRQKFNAYSAFARVAAEGTPQKPADLRAAAQAATQAYQNVPDGTSLSFQPTQGGIQIAVKKVIPSKPAPSGGEDNTRTQMMADGGEVEGEDAQPEDWQAMLRRGFARADGAPQGGEGTDMPDPTAGIPVSSDEDPEAQAYARPAKTPEQKFADVKAAGRGVLEALTPRRDENNMVQNFVLSIPQFIKWLTGPGQADSIIDKGVEATLADAQKQAPGVTPGAAPGAAPPMPTAPNTQYAFRGQTPAGPANTSPPGAFPGRLPGQEEQAPPAPPQDIPPDIERLAARLYPSLSQSAERTNYINQVMAQRAAQQNAIAVAKQQGVNQTERTRMLVGGRNDVADKNASARLQVEMLKQDHADGRNRVTNDTRFQIGMSAQQALANRTLQNNITRLITSEMMNKPNLVGKPEELAKNIEPLVAPMGLKGTEAVKWYYTQSPGPQAPQAPQAQAPQPRTPQAPQPQQPQQQVKTYQGRRYTRGPNGEAIDIGPAQ